MEWFRWFEGTATDPKFHLLARKSGQPVAFVLAVWAILLERASAAKPRGGIAGFDCESADAVMGMPDGAACAIVAAMQAKGLIDGERICKWEERQPVRERYEGNPSTDRVQRFRERQRNAIDGDETPCNANETPRNAQIREDKIREEKNINTPPLPPTGGRAGEVADASVCDEEDEPKPKRTRFAPPGADDVQAYCDERRNGINGQEFCDFYASKGWKVGNTPMKDWRAAVRTWERGRTGGGARASPAPMKSFAERRADEIEADFLAGRI